MNRNMLISIGFMIFCLLFVVTWGKMNRLEQRVDFLVDNFSKDVVYEGTIAPGEKVDYASVCEKDNPSACRLYAKIDAVGFDVSKVAGIFGYVKESENVVAASLEGGRVWRAQEPDFFEDDKFWYQIGTSNENQRVFFEAFDYKVVVSHQD